MIFDCFPFFNEKELLEIRLHELSSVVDKFVLVEATRTHTGLPKRLYYEEDKHLFSEFHQQIRHIIVDDMPITAAEIVAAISDQDRKWLDTGYQLGDDWVRERFQRNAIMRGLAGCDPDDIIIIGDADEIVRASILTNIENTICDGSNAVEQSFNSYYLNVVCTNMPWWGTKILRRKFITTPSEDRFHTPAACYIRNGGWHYNFLGGAEKIRQKLLSYAHQEFNISELVNLDRINQCLAQNIDVLGRLYQYKVVPMDDTFPKHVLENREKFGHLFYREAA